MTRDGIRGGQQRVDVLLDRLTDAEERLHQLGDGHWANWLARDRARVAQGDAYGLEHLKQAFGGMGSINDAYPQDDGAIGATLADIHRLAAQLLADHQAADGPGVHRSPPR
ncbi:hypothetical protein ACWT_3921 [Actinoplanes sp. SE50]|uniref:DUF6966 domain-containing protein n=1 Tax=unclassified Actinoplanes TaxID=2626549 RepID=UPI00023ED247|nr:MULTISPECIES: hypothetical protein [unclassified Actinoplanes]AEV84945.1 hypothetical protein ACPL_4050 [Actinoplanes sp. SE50/110]ATO83336.1 hypothetical protein ACWT_3921 [Actinoplanes sp. SE50]SLM00743.1 hypothetical protein ACSP50_3976 [Actinoplanes sp. SE50/110]